MQPIQDKELDQLFKNKFAEAEMLPSRDLWSSNLVVSPKVKKKKQFSFIWMAAASMAVVFTFSLFNKQEKLKLFNPNVEIAEEFESVEINEAFPSVDAEQPVVGVDEPAQQIVVATTKDVAKVLEVLPSVASMNPTVVAIETPISKVEVSTATIVYAAVEQPISQNTVLGDKVVSDVVSEKPERIRNVGGLVNFVVDKLDKRDKKAIQFKTEDDESSIIGINIGLFKFNAKRN